MRAASVTVAARNAELVAQLQTLKAEHPFWGYRRCWAQLRFGQKRDVNKKRIYRLMKTHGLLATQTKHLVSRTSTRSKPQPDRPGQWWGIDMTKVLTAQGWVYVVVVLDWYTKQIVGAHCGIRATARDWLTALEQGLNRQFPDGVREHGLHLMSDNGCQPTGQTFMQACALLNIHQAFTSYNNPKGNADTERMMRTLKEELVWLQEWPDQYSLTTALDQWIEHYNHSYLHSALGYRTPDQMATQFTKATRTLLEIAC